MDAARLPVYLATQGAAMARLWPVLLVAVVGVAAGTALGTRALARLPRHRFRRVVAVLLLLLGAYMLATSL